MFGWGHPAGRESRVDDAALAALAAMAALAWTVGCGSAGSGASDPNGEEGTTETETPDTAEPDPKEDTGTTDLPTPAVPVVSVDAGVLSTCAVFSDGGLKCWGLNQDGILGYGNGLHIGDNETPAKIGYVPLGAEATSVSVGGFHTCARTEGLHVRCWGLGESGALGYGTPDNVGDDEGPAAFGDVPLGELVAKVEAGRSASCAILLDGTVRCWGNDPFLGRIGDDETAAEGSEVPLSSVATDLAIAVSRQRFCAVLETGGVECWGMTSLQSEDPTKIIPLAVAGKATKVALGHHHECVIVEGGKLQCWADHWFNLDINDGCLGLPGTMYVLPEESPPFVDVGGPVLDVATGLGWTCVVVEGGAVRCWGGGGNGAILGLAMGPCDPPYSGADCVLGDDEAPAESEPVDIGGPAVAIAGSDDHVCALREDGAVLCWGRGLPALGYGLCDGCKSSCNPCTNCPVCEAIGDDEVPSDIGPIQLHP